MKTEQPPLSRFCMDSGVIHGEYESFRFFLVDKRRINAYNEWVTYDRCITG